MAQRIPWIGTSWKMNKLRGEARSFAQRLADSPGSPPHPMRPWGVARPQRQAQASFAFSG
jgi:hypothetical protein